ncbi:MAG: diguanylate cyclase [Clostridiales bacterium]|jgi:diguanylate cyclase (GGDEF)-like protein|nr:diguanylate cyclase [Clostridiales bacterium]
MIQNLNQQVKKSRILVIDDSPLELRALSMILSGIYDVKLANSGQIGLDLAQKFKTDLILLDLNMPGISGFEVLTKLKNDEDLADIPVIIVTGSDDSADEVKGLELGAADFIRKPIVDAIVKLRVGVHLQLRAQLKLVESFSLVDGLTGIGNRRNFDQTMRAEFRRAARSGQPLGMLMLDIDHFKRFNDRFGHINGDECLKTVAAVMTKTANRGSDFVFRWGGEEFIVLLGETPMEGVIAVAERLRQNIEDTAIYCGEEITFATVSIGAGAIIPSPIGTNPNDFKEVDYTPEIKKFTIAVNKALHRAKGGGRNRVELA